MTPEHICKKSKWASRDPIEEFGGINLYAFVANDSIGKFDPTGLADASAPKLKREPKPEHLTCCDQDRIGFAKSQILESFKNASAQLSQLCNPAPPGEEGASCKASSQDLIGWLLPTPSCWVCYLEQRNKFSPSIDTKNDMTDHQVIICRSYASSGVAGEEMVLDWWGDVSKPGPDQSGGPPTKFRSDYKYPDPDYHIVENGQFTDCCGNQKGGRTAKPNFECCLPPPSKRK